MNLLRPHKYGAKFEWYNDVLYRSKAEAARARQNDLFLRTGEVTYWLRQVPIQLGTVIWRVDFVCFKQVEDHRIVQLKPGQLFEVWAEEIKGNPKHKDVSKYRELWRKWGPFPLKFFFGAGSSGKWKSTEIVVAQEPTG